MAPVFHEPLGLFAQLACLWEVTARKPGNVHRWADFEGLTYLDFVASAAAIAPVFDDVALIAFQSRALVGRTIKEAITATRRVVQTNTNLGIVLLLAPLAWAKRAGNLSESVRGIVEQLDIPDGKEAYEAIRLARPGALGEVTAQDIRSEPTQTLREVMALASDRDLIARQYANGFREVFEDGLPALQHGLKKLGCLEDAIIYCHLAILAKHFDSLIARKCGKELAAEAGRRASKVIDAGWPHSSEGRKTIAEFDSWLRADGNRRNPGTTADLVTASLFVALREGIIILPLKVPWSKDEGKCSMTPDEIRDSLRAQPFEPFRMCMTDGKTFDIHHPELCMTGKRSVTIGIVADASDPLYDRTVKLDPLHILRLEPLPSAAPNKGNGQPKPS